LTKIVELTEEDIKLIKFWFNSLVDNVGVEDEDVILFKKLIGEENYE